MNQHLERINGLAPFLRPVALALIHRCERDLKRKLLVVRGWSSYAEQLRKYQQGRTFDRATGAWAETDHALIVTDAAPGLSAHNVVVQGTMAPASVAVDLIPLLVDGRPDWTVSPVFWYQLYTIAWKCGLDPLGDRIGSYLKGDLGHFEEPNWEMKLQGLGLIRPTIGDSVAA